MLFGFNEVTARKMTKILTPVLQSCGLSDESVVTFIRGSEVISTDSTNNNQPFVRICSPEVDELKRIKAVIQERKIKGEYEFLQLESFVIVQ